jgi:ABC-type multidrug transport system ATPase subunit
VLVTEAAEKGAGNLSLTLGNVAVSTPGGRLLLEVEQARFSMGVTALAGANGAGKSTLLRALCGLHPLSQGSVTLEGLESQPNRRAFLEHLVLLPQNFTTYPELTGAEFLEYALRLRGAGAQKARSMASAWLETVGLQQAAKAQVGTYSQGMRQRLGFAYAMQLDVSLYLLDEPFAGVDAEARQPLTDLLFRIARTRIAIVSTHHLDEMLSRGATVARLTSGRLEI